MSHSITCMQEVYLLTCFVISVPWANVCQETLKCQPTPHFLANLYCLHSENITANWNSKGHTHKNKNCLELKNHRELTRTHKSTILTGHFLGLCQNSIHLSFQTLTLNFSTQQLFSQQCRQTTDKRTSSKTLQRYNSIHWQNSLLFLLL